MPGGESEEAERVEELKRKYSISYEHAGKTISTGTTVYPSVYRREQIEELEKAQLKINRMIWRISNDRELLEKMGIGELVIEGEKIEIKSESDRMYQTLEKIRRNRKDKRKITAVFVRSDYIENLQEELKQVEMNTISCSFVLTGANVNRMHSELLEDREYRKRAEEVVGEKIGKLLISKSTEKFFNFIRITHAEYEKTERTKDSVVVILDCDTTPESKNYLEKAEIADAIEKSGIKSRYLSVSEFLKGYSIRNGSVLYYKDEEVAVVYYRWLYNADQYTEEIIKMRTDIESTCAVSIPNVEVQIAGLKIFQKFLCRGSFLEKYAGDKDLLKYFVQFLSVSEYSETKPAKEYVLKTLKEGGGNNFFGKDVERKLSEMPAEEEQEYFLMEKIEGKTRRNRAFNREPGDTIGEVGIFGYCVMSRSDNGTDRESEEIENAEAGYILRTKYRDSNEVGVSAGFGYLDSIAYRCDAMGGTSGVE